MKKLIALSLVAAIGMTCTLTGCKKSEEVADNKSPYEIDWFFIGTDQPDTELVEEKVNEYVKDSLNVTVKLHALEWGAYRQKINTMIAGSEKFDICFTDKESYVPHATRNAYLPLNELMDQYAPKTKEIIGEDFLKGSQINGKNYAIPSNKDKGHSMGIVYRKDIAQKHGLEEKIQAAKSLKELEPILEYIKENEPSFIPLKEAKGVSEIEFIDMDVVAFPAAFYPNSTDGKVVNMVETQEFADAVKSTRSRYVKGYLNQGGSIGGTATSKYFCEVQLLKPGKAEELASNKDYELGQVSMTPARMLISDTMGAMMAISRTSKNPERVMQFLEQFNTDPYLHNLIVFGIEGKHYTKISENRIELIPNSGYGFASMRWEFGNTFLQYLVKGELDDKVEKMQEFNKSLVKSNYLGFNFDSEPVKTELSACLNVKTEFESSCGEGLEDPETLLPRYIDKLKRAGADKIVEEVQRQYDEWKANNQTE